MIYADSGLMAYAANQRDLTLQLHNGVIHEYRSTEPDRFAVTAFTTSAMRVRNVFDELERNTSDQIRGDREMSSCEMMVVVREARVDRRRAARERARLVHRDLRELTGTAPAAGGHGRPRHAAGGLLHLDCAAARPARAGFGDGADRWTGWSDGRMDRAPQDTATARVLDAQRRPINHPAIRPSVHRPIATACPPCPPTPTSRSPATG